MVASSLRCPGSDVSGDERQAPKDRPAGGLRRIASSETIAEMDAYGLQSPGFAGNYTPHKK